MIINVPYPAQYYLLDYSKCLLNIQLSVDSLEGIVSFVKVKVTVEIVYLLILGTLFGRIPSQ